MPRQNNQAADVYERLLNDAGLNQAHDQIAAQQFRGLQGLLGQQQPLYEQNRPYGVAINPYPPPPPVPEPAPYVGEMDAAEAAPMGRDRRTFDVNLEDQVFLLTKEVHELKNEIATINFMYESLKKFLTEKGMV